MNTAEPIRVLHVVSILDAGGMENLIMNIYRMADRSRVQFDFLVHHAAIGLYEEEIRKMGGKVYHFTVMDDKNIFKYISELEHFFRVHREYRIIHGHFSSLAVFYLGAAKRHGCPWRIMHSHRAGFLHTPKGIMKHCLSRLAKENANIRLACSEEAGKYMYGADPFEVIPNGIDPNRFAFRPENRERVRKQLGIRDEYLIGHIGRFNLQKNHRYLLQIFKEVHRQLPDARLMLLGGGELFEKIKKNAEELGISEYVIFAGVHKDIENYYQAMDVFVLPSLFEGLPVTGIEAQYSGLPCLFSDTITREVQITQGVKFLKIGEENLSLWVNALAEQGAKPEERRVRLNSTQFDIRSVAKSMENRYLKLWEQGA